MSTEDTPPPTYHVLPKIRMGSRERLQPSQYSQSCGGSGTSSAVVAGVTNRAAMSGQDLRIGWVMPRLKQRLLQRVECAHGRQDLLDAAIGLAPLPDGREELPILQFDAVHRDVHLRDVDRIVLAIDQFVVTRDVRAVVADVAEESAQWAVVVEGQRQRADGAGGHFHLDAHVHGDLEFGMHRALDGARDAGGFTGLILEQIHGVAGVVPQQVVGPAARLAERIHVGAAEEVRLHVHLLDPDLAGQDLLAYPLVRGIEAPRMTTHADEAGFLLYAREFFGVPEVVGDRDFDLHVFAGAHALDALAGVHLRGSCKDRGFDAGLSQAFLEPGRPVRDAELFRDLGRRLGTAAGQRDDLGAGDLLDGFDVFYAEGALASDADFHDPYPLKQAPCTTVPMPCSTSARDRNDTPHAPSAPMRRAWPAT